MRTSRQSGSLGSRGEAGVHILFWALESSKMRAPSQWVSERRGGRREYTFRYFGPLKVPKCVLPGNFGPLKVRNFQGPKIPKCVLPPPPRLSETQIAWAYAFRNFQGPKIPKCVLPPPPRFPEIQVAWEYAFWNFQGPKIPKCVLPPPPRLSQRPRLPGSTHFGPLKIPKCVLPGNLGL